MQKPTNLKAGDKFRVIERYNGLKLGEIISLERDDGTENPYFWNADKSDCHSMYFSKLEPYAKTVRDAQVGDIVVDNSGHERMVLERWHNSVLLSASDNFRNAYDTYTFYELEEDYTLKAESEVKQTVLTMAQIAEKFGVDVSKLKIAKE